MASLHAAFPETKRQPLDLHGIVRPGLPIERLVNLAEQLGLGEENLARRCGLSRATWQRRKAGSKPLAASETDLLLRFAVLFNQAVEVFEDTEEAREWLKTPQYGLAGAVPLDLATTTFGFREVEKLLTRIDHGVYA